MTLELSLKPSLFLPRFIQTGNDEPRKSHWVGSKEPAQPQQTRNQGGRNDNPQKQRDARGYRELSSIRLGEVKDAYQFLANQLTPHPHESWIATGCFCMLDLVRKRDERPPAIFGRVKTCYPTDGYIHNIQDMELYFPHKDGSPDILLLQNDDILLNTNQPVQSYCVRVKFLASPEDIAEFNEHENLFLEKGFIPEFQTGYIDLLDLNEQNHAALPRLIVIGSRWFASIPESVQPEIREKLGKLIQWNKLIFNYHPERISKEIRSLNRELGYKAGFTDMFLLEPEDPHQTAQIVASAFEKVFMQAIK